MKKHYARVLLMGLAVTLASVAHATAKNPDPAVQKTFEKMLGAIKANDRDAFVAEGTDEVKKGVTQEAMESIEKQLGPRLKKGYEAGYLCKLKQAGHEVHLWKVTFKDGGDDLVFRLAIKEGKVGGFYLQ